jgi:hypothetical protein
VSQQTSAIVIFILVIILLLVVAFLGSNLLTKRALRAVIKTFRKFEALTPETARFVDEIGLKNRGMFQMRGFRDYKPAALQFLMKHEIVKATEEGKLFLSEETLAQTEMETRIGGRI